MTTSTEMETIREEIARLSGHKNSRRYPSELRARVVRWARDRRAGGASIPTMCAELGMGEPTLRKFLGSTRQGPSSSGAQGRAEKKPGFNAVRVTAGPSTSTSAAKKTPTAVVRVPGGVTVEGLTVEEIAELARRLACWA